MGRFETANKTALPAPSHFALAIMSTSGDLHREYPTFSLSYLGCNATPSDGLLGDIQAFATNFEPNLSDTHTTLEIVAYLQPRKELLDFSDSIYLKIEVPVKETNSMFHRIEESGRYVVLINTEYYCYRALVDDGSGEVLESSIEYRYLS